MIVVTRLVFKGFDGFTVWPFIFVRPEARHDHGLIEHEKVHLVEQRRWLVLPWLAAYLISKRFRCNAEVRAYREQIAVGGICIRDAAAALMKYRLGINHEEALRRLSQ